MRSEKKTHADDVAITIEVLELDIESVPKTQELGHVVPQRLSH